MPSRSGILIGVQTALLCASYLAAAAQTPFLLEERRNFSPGVVLKATELYFAGGLRRPRTPPSARPTGYAPFRPVARASRERDGGLVLDREHPTLVVRLPTPKPEATYALMCRSKAVADRTFNWIEVAARGRSVARIFPCTNTYTDKKVLLPGGPGAESAVSFTLKEGPGCVLESFRVYDAKRAYYIKRLSPADSRPTPEPRAFTPDPLFRKRAIQSALWVEKWGRGGGMTNLRGLVKRTHNWGADPETFKMMIGRYIEYLETPQLPRQKVWNTSFQMHLPIQRWDEIESRPAFSDALRLEIVNTFYLMARISFIDWSACCLCRYYRGYRRRYEAEWEKLDIGAAPYLYPRENMVAERMAAAAEFNENHPFLPHNHMTHPSRALLFAARYFERYRIPEVPIWYRCARWVFEPLMHSSKPMEDCSTYQYGAMGIAADFAIAEGRHAFFAKGGPLWKFMDLLIVSANNLGDGPGHGDVSTYPQKVVARGPIETDVFDAAVGSSSMHMTDEFRRMLGDKRRGDYLGVHVHPLEPLFYEFQTNRRGGTPIPKEQRFDKISFRRSFAADDQYLLLDGISFGYHGHQDGNSIIQFDDEGRTWLVERGYPKTGQMSGVARAEHHNTVVVSRPDVNDGEPSPLHRTPTFSALLYRHDGDRIGITSTISRDLNGVDWTRHIVWAKERYFVVMDEIVAREAGPVTLTCLWRTLGEPRLEGHRFQVTQKPKADVEVDDRRELSFVLIRCGDAAVSLGEGIEPPRTWQRYPYAAPGVHVLRERFEGNLKAGDSYVFLNVFAVLRRGDEHALQARRLNEGAVQVTFREERQIVELDGRNIPRVR